MPGYSYSSLPDLARKLWGCLTHTEIIREKCSLAKKQACKLVGRYNHCYAPMTPYKPF